MTVTTISAAGSRGTHRQIWRCVASSTPSVTCTGWLLIHPAHTWKAFIGTEQFVPLVTDVRHDQPGPFRNPDRAVLFGPLPCQMT